MTIYNYTAIKNGSEQVKGKLEASNLKEARMQIRQMGLIPIQLSEDSLLKPKETENKITAQKLKPLKLNEKIEFTSSFQILIQAGIPTVEALMFLENDAANAKLRNTAKELRRQIIAGSTFADTLARYLNIFGHVYVGLAKAGEESGELEKTFDRLLELLKKQANIKSKVIGTLMYPAFVILLAVVVVLVMLIFVFPAFREMFEMQEQELPAITQLMVDAGDFLKLSWPVIPIGFILFFALCITVFNWKPARMILDKVVLKVPLLSSLIMYSNFSNFMAVLQVAYDAGVPIVDSLYLSIMTFTNSTLHDKIAMAIDKVKQGQQLSQSLKNSQVIPKMLLFMIATGEQSGKLGEMLLQAVSFLDKKLDAIIDTLTKMIEPVMLLVIGGIVLVMALALYLPLFQSYMLQ